MNIAFILKITVSKILLSLSSGILQFMNVQDSTINF